MKVKEVGEHEHMVDSAAVVSCALTEPVMADAAAATRRGVNLFIIAIDNCTMYGLWKGHIIVNAARESSRRCKFNELLSAPVLIDQLLYYLLFGQLLYYRYAHIIIGSINANQYCTAYILLLRSGHCQLS